MTYETKLPPAILLGADTPVGLTVIRELGEHGVSVHAVARSREGIGLYSKWVTRGYLRPRDEDSTIDLLNRIASEHGAQFLLAIAERDLLVIRAAADAGRLVGLQALVPAAAQLAIAHDKSATYTAAREIGVPVPATWQPRDGPTIETPPDELTFPCVLKWRDPENLGNALAALGIPSLEAEYCHDRTELKRALARYEPYERYPLVQAFCPGRGLGHMIFLYRSEAILRIHNAFRRDLQRQRQVVADLRCENAQVVAPPIEVPRELSDADRSNHIRGREGKADDQDPHTRHRRPFTCCARVTSRAANLR